MELNQAFTCIGRGHGAPCQPATREEWEEMRRQKWLADMCDRIERGDEELKHRLPVWTPHCAEFKGNHRAIGDALKPLSRLMLDFDEKGHTGDILSRLSEKGEELRMRGIEVLLVEESVRRGTHVLVELPTGMNADEAQTLMQKVTGFEPDKAVKDVARCIYMVPEDHTKFVSDKLWEPGLSPSPLPVKEGSGQEEDSKPSSLGGERGDRRFPMEFKGISYEEIIAEYWRRVGGEPTEGERNDKLHKLAANLRAICDDKEEWLLEVMPRYGLPEAEMRSIIHSACKEPTRGSKQMQEILRTLSDSPLKGEEDENLSLALSQGEGESPKGRFSAKKLPIGLKESLVGIPESMHMPVLCAVLPIAATYADGVEVEYCDGQIHRLGLMSIIRGEQASNKSICKTVVDVWKRQFDQEDALAREREDVWKDRKKGRKANEKAPDDPKVLIRVVPVTISCSTLLKRLKNGQGHCIYSFGEELDTLRKTNGAGSWSSKYDIYRMAFDYGEWGQDYNSDQAESGNVRVAYNWTMLGTYGAVRRCFKSDNIENGLSSRVLMAEMPDGAFAPLTKFTRRSEADEQRIQEAVTKLRSYSGFIDTPRLRRAIDKWVEEKRVIAAKNIDYVMDVYRRRAAVIGFRCGVIFRLLEGRESNASLKFAITIAEYCMEQQIKAFGELLRSSQQKDGMEDKRKTLNNSIFDQLPTVFSMGDLKALKQVDCNDDSLRSVISRWKRDEWVEKIDSKHWKKRIL